MMRAVFAGLLVSFMWALAGPAARAQTPDPATVDLSTAITNLGSFDFATRTEAARAVRRTPADEAVPRLVEAVQSHPDGYVRYKALVLLSGFDRPQVAEVMRAAATDPNDRLRTVAFAWFEHSPDPTVVPTLLTAVETEGSEFVRPALTRALAAHGADPRVRAVLPPLVMRGEDFFRGAVIVALGDYDGTYALAEIAQVAELDGPLQDDAITTLGKIGGDREVAVLAGLQRTAPPDVQPTISAALCLLGRNCDRHVPFIEESLTYAAQSADNQPLVRGAAHALGMLATEGRAEALTRLLDVGIGADESVRAPIALTVGLVAFRNAPLLLDVIEARADRREALELLLDAFDMLSEDFEEERFYTFVREAYWNAPEGSERRTFAGQVLEVLEF